MIHLLDSEGRPLCETMVQRDSLTDAEFWEDVFHPGGIPDYDIPQDDWPSEATLGSPCEECGATGACAYDAQGRPMIHTTDL